MNIATPHLRAPLAGMALRSMNLLKKPSMLLSIFLLTGVFGLAQGFDLQGHRGARGLMPENTLPAFARALSIGVSTLELDLAVTRDHQVVVMHNPRFEPEIARDARGNWLQQSSPSIRSMSLAEVKSYDVGRLNPASKYAARYPQQRAIDGTPVPTLGEVFELANRAGNRTVRFNIEVKINPENPHATFPPETFVRAVVDVIREYGMTQRVVVQSFDWRALQAVQVMAPEISTSYLTVDQDWLSNLQTGMRSGLYGIEHEIEPPVETKGDATAQIDPTLQLPATLEAAVERLRDSKAAREVLGEKFVDHYVRTRDWECREYRKTVSEWELKRYFEAV